MQQLASERQKRQEKVEVEKEEEEGNKQDKEDAPTNTDLLGMARRLQILKRLLHVLTLLASPWSICLGRWSSGLRMET